MREYIHGGKLGDIVFSIPAFRRSGCDVYTLLVSGRPGDLHCDAGAIIGLLGAQAINVRVLRGGGVRVADPGWVDGDLFKRRLLETRTFDRRRRLNNVERHLRAIGVSDEFSAGGWLSVRPRREAGVVFVRSARYRPVVPAVEWRSMVQASAGDNLFLGTLAEFGDFLREFRVRLPYVGTRDYLDAARIIAGADYVVTNQTGLQAVTVGLGIPHVLERCEVLDHCVFDASRQWLSSDSFWRGPVNQ